MRDCANTHRFQRTIKAGMCVDAVLRVASNEKKLYGNASIGLLDIYTLRGCLRWNHANSYGRLYVEI